VVFIEQLRSLLEQQEHDTVGKAFGGPATKGRSRSYSVASIRNYITEIPGFTGNSSIKMALRRAYGVFSTVQFTIVVASLIRYSFLIELTNLTVGSTKMKTRWLPGLILMPQDGSYEPIRGRFEPGNDPRAASFDDCVEIFTTACNLVCDEVSKDASVKKLIEDLGSNRRVPYEFPLSYQNTEANPVHTGDNVKWVLNDDARWLIPARKILRTPPAEHARAIRALVKAKIQVKVFKTDRSLTGKDKTNRAKRWEVLAGDFQYASLEQCWSAERRLTADLATFADFPDSLRQEFVQASLLPPDVESTCCPVTLEQLSFADLADSLLNPQHGVSQYQVGHLYPLKRGGNHDGENVCWQSANGNRIQGDLSVEETTALLASIAERRSAIASA